MTNPSPQNLEQEILQTVRERVMYYVEQNPTPRQQALWQRVLIWFGSGALLVLGFWLLLVFIHQLRTNAPLYPLVGWDWSGLVWIWFPETILLGLIAIVAAFFLKNLDSLISLRLANFTFSIVVIFGVLGSIWLSSNPAVIAQSEVYTNWLLADYRIEVRDQYVQVLNERGEFYGAVAQVRQQNGQTIVDIDHGGAVKTFALPISESQNIQAGDLIWVKYETKNEEKIVTEWQSV